MIKKSMAVFCRKNPIHNKYIVKHVVVIKVPAVFSKAKIFKCQKNYKFDSNLLGLSELIKNVRYTNKIIF